MSMAISSSNAAKLAEGRAVQSFTARQRLANQISAEQNPVTTPGIGANPADQSQLREKFDAFVGESFYGQMLQAMHKTVGKPAYFHGGRAEEAFQGQLDQVLSSKLSQASAGQFSGPMFDLFNLQMQ